MNIVFIGENRLSIWFSVVESFRIQHSLHLLTSTLDNDNVMICAYHNSASKFQLT